MGRACWPHRLTLIRVKYFALMLTNRPFRLVVTALIAIGLHLCCCQLSLFGMAHAHGSVSQATGCDGHNQRDGEQHSTPQPDEAPHDCCGVHAKPYTAKTTTFDLPDSNVVADVPPCISFVVEEHICKLWDARSVSSIAPRPETSLLRCHCALIV